MVNGRVLGSIIETMGHVPSSLNTVTHIAWVVKNIYGMFAFMGNDIEYKNWGMGSCYAYKNC